MRRESDMNGNTVILKWNPAISSVSMMDFLDLIANGGAEMNWSIREYEKVHRGDRFYMLKVGAGPSGIVAAGVLTSDPYPDEDWSGRGRTVYYCDYTAEIMINPAVFDLLGSEELRDSIPDFDWYGGHSGTVLTGTQADALELMWNSYLHDNAGEFRRRLDLTERRGTPNDQLLVSTLMMNQIGM